MAAIAGVLVVAPAVAVPLPAAEPPSTWGAPIPGPLQPVRPFVAPSAPWAAGHRGVDLAATSGSEVRSAGPGVVAFAGPVAGRWVVAVVHVGGLRTSYEPVMGAPPVGTAVAAGDPIGRLSTVGSHCAPRACLHWGLRVDGVYADPMSLLDHGPVRLLPVGPAGDEPARRGGAAGRGAGGRTALRETGDAARSAMVGVVAGAAALAAFGARVRSRRDRSRAFQPASPGGQSGAP
jgi:hypothetical protein